uniref:Abnormal spindle-like microcephaly-associated protein ASH domain-containing protein n=1 Tax=Chromera velia CCMP2878 TaxID=1169474 RepID=A0A0G4IDG3_9ALVE|eukprot:Cvel_13433.t1-p1 / transcript=Cvel_13433.t1 / gene=Cvel_13433 / organism=Chromera_velia_CCMP2878 / gene_product=Primary ciliary dyskinesia protein 1, putative / transcript_product=Primary ciliary dyskinesia protein 1, putative / location=Cvel_scaffold916:50828-55708(+) / protein_length=984 / sequence_SO=supercontig / SO=protein_coding / is_pseudo=false
MDNEVPNNAGGQTMNVLGAAAASSSISPKPALAREKTKQDKRTLLTKVKTGGLTLTGPKFRVPAELLKQRESRTFDPDNPATSPLILKNRFEKLGENDLFVVEPAVIHFAGFEPLRRHVQSVYVRNKSTSTQRVTVIPPTTPFFSTKLDKKGRLAPGMAERIDIVFNPTELRYYYDQIRIHCESRDKLLIPLHGFPANNAISLPRFVDMGVVKMGETKTVFVPLQSRTQVDFEFQIMLTQEHADILVSPLAGVIPANDTTNIEVSFCPSEYGTAVAEVQVDLAQFGFEPVTVGVMGCCMPCVEKDERVASGVEALKTREVLRHMDAFECRVQRLEEGIRQGRGELEVHEAEHEKPREHKLVHGVQVPMTVKTPGPSGAATSFILRQEEGKRPLKDFFAFVQEQRKRAEQRRERANVEEDLEAAEEDMQAKEMRYELKWRGTDEYDRGKELKTGVFIGNLPPPLTEVNAIGRRREARHAALLRDRLRSDLCRYESEISAEPVLRPSGFRPKALPSFDAHATPPFSLRLQVIDKFQRAVTRVLQKGRILKNMWALQKVVKDEGVMDRSSARQWLQREAERAAMGAAPLQRTTTREGGRRSSVADAERLEKDPTAGPSMEFESLLDKLPTLVAQSSAIGPESLPFFHSQGGGGGGAGGTFAVLEEIPFDGSQTDDFSVFADAPVREQREWEVMELPEMDVLLPRAGAFMRSQKHRPHLRAALEDESTMGPQGAIDDGCEVPVQMPEECTWNPISLIVSDMLPAACSEGLGADGGGGIAEVPLPPCNRVETDLEFVLSQPVPVRHPDPTPSYLPISVQAAAPLSSLYYEDPTGSNSMFWDPLPIFNGCSAGGACRQKSAAASEGGLQGVVFHAAAPERVETIPRPSLEAEIASDSEDEEDRCEELRALAPPDPTTFMGAFTASAGGEAGPPPPQPQRFPAPIVSERGLAVGFLEDALAEVWEANAQAQRTRLDQLNSQLAPENKISRG